jgi:hypothetical protein
MAKDDCEHERYDDVQKDAEEDRSASGDPRLRLRLPKDGRILVRHSLVRSSG